jgi:hypothetical protein
MSKMASFAPESCSPKASSAPLHQAFSGTTTAPTSDAAKKATGHSGMLRMAMATRSPFTAPRF